MTKYTIVEEFKKELMKEIDANKNHARSAWDKGVNLYAAEIAAELVENLENGYTTLETMKDKNAREKAMLNGAENWNEYSWGGCSLIYDYDIAERLCTPSELKKTRNGERRPNSNEEWLDVQARALKQAKSRVHAAVHFALENIGMEA